MSSRFSADPAAAFRPPTSRRFHVGQLASPRRRCRCCRRRFACDLRSRSTCRRARCSSCTCTPPCFTISTWTNIPALAHMVVRYHGKAVRATSCSSPPWGSCTTRRHICNEATRCTCGGATIFLGPPLRQAAAAKASNVSPLPRSRPPPAAYAATSPQPLPPSPARSPPPTPPPSQPPPSLSPRPTAVTAASFAAAPVQPLTLHAPPPPSAPP